MRRCIYADSLLTKIKAYRPYMYLGEDALSYAIKMVELEPSADVRENVKGKWIIKTDGFVIKRVWGVCSECGNILDFSGVNAGRGDANFCPNCGADMRGDQT